MPERPKIPLTFGAGLDRATGILGAQPTSMRDVRNVYLYRGKAEARKGHTVTSSLLDGNGVAVSDVVLVHSMRAEQMGIAVGYQSTDRTVHVYRIDKDGGGANRIGTWFTLAAGAHEPPRILAAESYRKLFLAHDEPQHLKRAQTYYYDPFGSTQLVGLACDLDRSGGTPEAIRFRGVREYLNYIFGWGYGTGSDEDRPEVVRVSLPGQPTVFEPEHYFLAGMGDDPVLACQPTADRLMVFKGADQHEIIGYDRRTFGIKPGEQVYGVGASRLAVALNGVVYFWSSEGPRMTTGGASRDLAWPLDLDAPAPSDLVVEGALVDGFAVYLPGRRVIQFIFGKRCYNLSIWNPDEPKWSYGELGVTACCGGVIVASGEAQTGAPTGYATAVSGTGKVGTTDTLTVNWTNNSAYGDEFVEVWLKPTGGAWTLRASFAVSGATQQGDVAGLAPATNHDIALRYRRGPYYTAGYESGDPTNWPAGCKGTGSTLVNAPTLDTTSWERLDATTERGNVTFTPAHAGLDVVVRRGSVEIATVTAAQHGGAQYTYHDTAIGAEANNIYDCLHRGDQDSAASNAITQWGGPSSPCTLLSAATMGSLAYQANWTVGDGTLQTEVWDRNITDAGSYTLRTTVAAGVGAAGPLTPATPTVGDSIGVNVRHKKTSFTVTDYSAWVNGTNDPAIDEATVTLV